MFTKIYQNKNYYIYSYLHDTQLKILIYKKEKVTNTHLCVIYY